MSERERESDSALMDRRHGRYVRHTPKSASKPCGSDLASVFLRFFPLLAQCFSGFSLRCFSLFHSVVVAVAVAGNSNCRWADETMTIEMAMKLAMGWRREVGCGRGRGRGN